MCAVLEYTVMWSNEEERWFHLPEMLLNAVEVVSRICPKKNEVKGTSRGGKLVQASTLYK